MEARGREIEGEIRKRAGERENGGEKRKRETSPRKKKVIMVQKKKNCGGFWTIDSHPMADIILSLFVPYIWSLR
jgi:hypothetical protein